MLPCLPVRVCRGECLPTFWHTFSVGTVISEDNNRDNGYRFPLHMLAVADTFSLVFLGRDAWNFYPGCKKDSSPLRRMRNDTIHEFKEKAVCTRKQ